MPEAGVHALIRVKQGAKPVMTTSTSQSSSTAPLSLYASVLLLISFHNIFLSVSTSLALHDGTSDVVNVNVWESEHLKVSEEKVLR